MEAIRSFIFLTTICALAAVLAGCFGTSPPSRFYTFAPQGIGSTPESGTPGTAVAIGPVTIPDYLDCKQIVTRTGPNEIALSEFDRWGGMLDNDINRVLVSSVGERLNRMKLAIFPWRDALPANGRTIYRIPVNIVRFDGALGGKVFLDATWTVFEIGKKQENVVLTKASTISEKVTGKGYDALVDAMGKAVVKLGQEISDSLRPVVEKKSPE